MDVILTTSGRFVSAYDAAVATTAKPGQQLAARGRGLATICCLLFLLITSCGSSGESSPDSTENRSIASSSAPAGGDDDIAIDTTDSVDALIECAESNSEDATSLGLWSASFECDDEATRRLLSDLSRAALIPQLAEEIGLDASRLRPYDTCLEAEIDALSREAVLEIAADNPDNIEFGSAMFAAVEAACQVELVTALAPESSDSAQTLIDRLQSEDSTWEVQGPLDGGSGTALYALQRSDAEIYLVAVAETSQLISVEVSFNNSPGPDDSDQILAELLTSLGEPIDPEDAEIGVVLQAPASEQLGDLFACSRIVGSSLSIEVQSIEPCGSVE